HRPIPYAYKAELDAWWTSRSDAAAAPLAADATIDATSDATIDATIDAPRWWNRSRIVAAVAAAILVTAGACWTLRRAVHGGAAIASQAAASAQVSPKSIAVLPFLDLSEGMKNEEFADGITEELIDRLSRIPGFHVPAPTVSFYYKNRKTPVA